MVKVWNWIFGKIQKVYILWINERLQEDADNIRKFFCLCVFIRDFGERSIYLFLRIITGAVMPWSTTLAEKLYTNP